MIGVVAFGAMCIVTAFVSVLAGIGIGLIIYAVGGWWVNR